MAGAGAGGLPGGGGGCGLLLGKEHGRKTKGWKNKLSRR